jgi:hypothetical protein
MIVDLSGAALQGAPVVTEDVGLWFRNLGDPRMRRALRAAGATYVPAFDLNPPMLIGEGTQPFDIAIRMSGLGEFDDEFENTIVVELGGLRLRVLSLERILASKEAANRPKDRLVIPVLRNTLATLQALAERKRKKPAAPRASRPRRRRPRSPRGKVTGRPSKSAGRK